MKKIIIPIFIIIASSLFFGCSSSPVLSVGPDTYMVTASGAGFGTAGVRQTVFQKANQFCQSQGLVMIPVSFNAVEGKLGSHPPNADLVFRALHPDDPEVHRPNISEADYQLDVKQDIKQDVRHTAVDETKGNSELSDNLIKLHELYQQGIISEEEYQNGKDKLLK